MPADHLQVCTHGQRGRRRLRNGQTTELSVDLLLEWFFRILRARMCHVALSLDSVIHSNLSWAAACDQQKVLEAISPVWPCSHPVLLCLSIY